jgi:hypothetical protein
VTWSESLGGVLRVAATRSSSGHSAAGRHGISGTESSPSPLPKREWGLASLPAPTVRGLEHQAGEGEAPFLGAGSGRGLAAPVGSLLAFLRSRSFSGPPGWPMKRTSRVPLDHRQANLSDLRKETSGEPEKSSFGQPTERTPTTFLSRVLRPKSPETPDTSGKWGRLRLSPLPHASSSRCPANRFSLWFSLRRTAAWAVTTSG